VKTLSVNFVKLFKLALVLQLSHKAVLQNCNTSKLDGVTKIKTFDFQLVNKLHECSK
jgi:hypothetical protein